MRTNLFFDLVERNQKMGDYSSSTTPSGDSELQDFLMAEKQKAQVNAQVSGFQ